MFGQAKLSLRIVFVNFRAHKHRLLQLQNETFMTDFKQYDDVG